MLAFDFSTSDGGNVAPADRLVRLLPDGQPDVSFGPSGMQVVTLGSIAGSPRGIVVDRAGRAIVGGGSFEGQVDSAGLERRLASGERDLSYGQNGVSKACLKVETQPGQGAFSSATGPILDGSGRTLIATTVVEDLRAGKVEICVARLLGDNASTAPGLGVTPTPSEAPELSVEAIRPRTPVVLVAGLNENTHSVTPNSSCRPANDFRTLCEHLRLRGFPIFVPSSSKGGARSVLDNQAPIDGNAVRLASYLKGTVGKYGTLPPLLVGHSMGGIIARVAVSRYRARAFGLFPIGTPHDGSFWALRSFWG